MHTASSRPGARISSPVRSRILERWAKWFLSEPRISNEANAFVDDDAAAGLSGGCWGCGRGTCGRSDGSRDCGERAAKRERWRRIAEDAARQSDAKWLPEISAAVDFRGSLELVKRCVCFVGALTDPPPEPLLSALQRRLDANETARSFGLFVGPEGDFTPEELAALVVLATPVSFGPTVLRAETAAIFGLAVLAAASHSRTNFYAATLGGGRSRGACTADASELLCSDRLVGTVLSIK